MLCNKPQNLDVICYFCITTLSEGFNVKNKQQIVYADVPSMSKPAFTHVPKAENNLGVIENKRNNSEGDDQNRNVQRKTRFYSIKLN